MRRSTSTVRRACAVGTTAALVVLTTGLGIVTATAAHADTGDTTTQTPAAGTGTTDPNAGSTSGSGTSTGTTDPNAGATSGSGTTTGTDAGTDPTAPGTGTDAGTGSGSGSGTGTDGTTPDSTGGAGASSGTTTPGSTGTGTTTTPAPTTVTPKAADPAAAAPTATISGTTKVGSQLTGDSTGFKADGDFRWVWTDTTTGAVLSNKQFYVVDAAQAGKTVTLTVTGDRVDGDKGTATTESAVITQDPAFLGADGKPTTEGADADDPLFLDTTAGDTFSYTFRAQGSPAPTYKLDWFYADEDEESDSIVSSRSQASSIAAAGVQDETDGEFTPADQLPDGITFDAATGELSGSTELASYYDFAVTATSGTVSTTQYVELTVDPAAAAGILAYTLDAADASEDAKDVTEWVIAPDGSVSTIEITFDSDGFPDSVDFVPGGRPTVKQGGTLLVGGEQVDRFGNLIDSTDEDGNSTFVPTVTSNVASDVVAPYTEDGAQGVVGVTFPHASTHTLTVSGGALASTSFAVEVQPVASTVAVVTPVGGRGELAYTGSDATGALPWALGLVAAGAGIIGAGAYRRRRAQR